MPTDKITFLTNWHATPYHTPLYLAQAKGYFKDEGIKVAIMEPNDPSDVTEIIGSKRVDLGFKAMIHTLAAKARDFPIQCIGSLLDEPFTGVVYLKDSGITPDFHTLKGKRIGYVGEFGKIQIDELTSHYGMSPSDYTAIPMRHERMVELAEWLSSQGRPKSDVQMLRIDELAELGCCCFCSILYIGNETFINENPEKVRAFMRAVNKATDFVLADPEAAWTDYVDFKPVMGSELNRKIFEQVTRYGKRLGVLAEGFTPNYTNQFLEWTGEGEQADPTGDQKRMVELQKVVAEEGGFRRLDVRRTATAGA
ncbi:thiamine biosynthesis protein Nmt1 [Zymoseptoria brevis]|uniref:4-amino-5-hydroxymethyl-2-methylpyrimidine phosphate synthase n=1 Tax=Zymoseptoria brevis TaxID=1047168 RepID=A0A0F4GN73_9PEZI|nr:thiamine biosynthesis protein Nmt1 [Zymoseptoria brevis]